MCYITKNATDSQYAMTYAMIDTRHDATFTKNASDNYITFTSFKFH